MRETKYYCDVCGKEISAKQQNIYIPVVARKGKHGMLKRDLKIIDCNGEVCLDFCDDCKATIAILFGEAKNDTSD